MKYVDVFELLCVNTATNSVVSSLAVYSSFNTANLQPSFFLPGPVCLSSVLLFCVLLGCCLVVSIGASDFLERLVSKMTYYVSTEKLTLLTHSLTLQPSFSVRFMDMNQPNSRFHGCNIFHEIWLCP